ncbi:MAG TPA: helix-turn-helix domain-containing protein [Terriglobia bacterium]|nr:helix-turn-helix domain-containing protein [Terriglobia bacterium]
MKERLLNPGEVSELTGIPTATLAQWRYRKQGMRYLRIGRLVRYDHADVVAYLQRCRIEVRGQSTERSEHVRV